jgi:hypothetical protein
MRKRRRGIEKETSRDRQKGEEKEKEEIRCGCPSVSKELSPSKKKNVAATKNQTQVDDVTNAVFLLNAGLGGVDDFLENWGGAMILTLVTKIGFYSLGMVCFKSFYQQNVIGTFSIATSSKSARSTNGIFKCWWLVFIVHPMVWAKCQRRQFKLFCTEGPK